MDSFPCAILCRLKLVYSLSVSVPLHETLSSLVCLTRATLRSSKNFEGHLQHYKHNREHAPSIWTSPSLSTALISAASCWADIKHFALKKKEENMRMCKSTLFWKKIHQFSLISHLFFLKKKKKNMTGKIQDMLEPWYYCVPLSLQLEEKLVLLLRRFSLCWIFVQTVGSSKISLNWRISNYGSP